MFRDHQTYSFRSPVLEHLLARQGVYDEPIFRGRAKAKDANAAVATYSGRSILWNRVKGSGTEPKNIQWGDSTVTASANPDVNLFKPQSEARSAGTSTLTTTTQLADTYQVTGTVTCAVGVKTITEAGLFDATTSSPTTTVAASMTASATAMTIGSGTGLPGSGNYYMQLENEVVLVTAGQGTTTLTVSRGVLGSTSAVHSSGVATTLGGDGGAGTGGATSGQTATVAAAQGGNVFIHADFAGIALSVSDAINFTFKDQLTLWFSGFLAGGTLWKFLTSGAILAA